MLDPTVSPSRRNNARALLSPALAIALVGLAAACAGCGAKTAVEPARIEYFNDSTPLHDDVYAAPPINVTINLAVDVTADSTISVRNDAGNEWTAGDVKVEDVGTALQKDLRPGMPDGDYQVNYRVCLAAGGCSDGSFAFSVDSSRLARYEDMRGQAGITVGMAEGRFSPQKVRITTGTTVTWVNRDRAVHFVNTETHPEHTYYPPQNSLGLEYGESFSVLFERPGQYDYHCSAHYPQGMVGSIVVEP